MQDRPLYRHADLARLIEPAHIAVIGASPREMSFGDRILANLADYDGAIYPVNAKYERIGGRPCYPSIAALPHVPDCAIIVSGRETVEGLVTDCARAGVGGVVVCASGYAEVGRADRAADQARLTAIARTHRMPVVGPNCIGILSAARHARTTFMAVLPPPQVRPGAIGMISQSGALGFALAQAAVRGVSFSHILSSGNSCDVDAADYVAYLADDPNCAVIACVFEGLAQPRRMLAAARLAREADKPLIVFKIATGEEGAAAALSHTGSLAGTQAAYEAAFRREGAILVSQFEHLVETAAFFAKAGRARGPGVAVLATSGGAAIMAADRAEDHRVPLPQPRAEVRAVIERHIPEFGAARNPCDVTAQVMNDPASLNACAGALLAEPDYAALVVPQPYSYAPTAARIPVYAGFAEAAGKPIVMVWATEHLAGPGVTEIEASPHLALFRSMSGAFAALAAWLARGPAARPAESAPAAVPPDARARAAALIEAEPGRVLTERTAKQVLAAYGIPTVAERTAAGADEAVAAAEALGYPVVLKGDCPDLPHKTEAGIVRLALADQAGVRAAWASIADSAARHGARLEGGLVQAMAPPGVEIVVGARIDPLFGPLVVVGLGGLLVEVLRDTALSPAPISPDEALALLARLRGARLLEGFRDRPAVDRAHLAEIISRVSVLAADQADLIAELDINPFIASGRNVVAVDGLIVKRT